MQTQEAVPGWLADSMPILSPCAVSVWMGRRHTGCDLELLPQCWGVATGVDMSGEAWASGGEWGHLSGSWGGEGQGPVTLCAVCWPLIRFRMSQLPFLAWIWATFKACSSCP